MAGVNPALNFDTEVAAEEILSLLAVDGQVFMPFGPNFWAKSFGMPGDKFGINWVINGVLLIQ